MSYYEKSLFYYDYNFDYKDAYYEKKDKINQFYSILSGVGVCCIDYKRIIDGGNSILMLYIEGHDNLVLKNISKKGLESEIKSGDGEIKKFDNLKDFLQEIIKIDTKTMNKKIKDYQMEIKNREDIISKLNNQIEKYNLIFK